MLRVIPSQLAQIIKNEKDTSELKKHLKYIFSFKENIDSFAAFFFPDVMTNISPDFHNEIYELLFSPDNEAIAAPRGHAKSTITGLIFLTFCIVNKLDKYIVYISQSHSKTIQFLAPIRHEFKANELLRSVYGDLTPRNSKDADGKDTEDCFDVNGIRVEAVSFEKNLRGFKYGNSRPTLIIGDDIEDDDRVLNPELRVKDENKLNKVIIPALDIDGRFKMIGTILHINSLLRKKIKQYDGKIYTACTVNYKKILWAERFTEAKLKKIKKDIGSIAFQQEYLNNPIDTTASLIKREWIIQCLREDLSYQDLKDMAKENKFKYKFEGTDFAFSDRITADNSAFASVGVKEEFYYIFDIQIEKGLSIFEQLTLLEEKHQAFRYDQVGLEENSIKAVSKDLSGSNLPLTLFWTAASDPAARLKADYNFLGKRHTVGKHNLIIRLGTAFENKKFIIPYKTEEDKRITDRLISELISFALADGRLVEAGIHPDIPIALGYALELINNMESVIFDFGEGF